MERIEVEIIDDLIQCDVVVFLVVPVIAVKASGPENTR